MANLIIELPDDLVRSLEGLAASEHKSVEQLGVERLRSLLEESSSPQPGTAEAVLRAMRLPPHPSAADVDELERAIAAGDKHLNTGSKRMSTKLALEDVGKIANWPNLGAMFPVPVSTLPLLSSILVRAFRRDDNCIRDIGVFGLGRLAVQDFLEILFLAESGYGIAALKLSRGLYEKAITAEYIERFPAEAQRFHDFYAIQSQKLQDRRSRVYPSSDSRRPRELNEWYQDVKNDFKAGRCTECGQPRQHGFTDRSLEAMAICVGKKLQEEGGKPRGVPNHLERAYLPLAAIPNIHIHASIQSFFLRCIVNEKGTLSFRDDEKEETSMAFVSSLSIMSLVAETQERCFSLGLRENIDKFCALLQEHWA